MVLLKIFLLIVLNLNICNCLRLFDIRWRSVKCTAISKAHFGFFNCSLNELPRNRGNYVTVHLQFSKTIESILMDFKVSMPSQIAKDMELIQFRVNGCQMSKRKSNNPAVAALAKQILQTGNFSSECPLRAFTTYTVDHLSLNPDYFPGFTPEMTFVVKVRMYKNKIHLLTVNAIASVVMKK